MPEDTNQDTTTESTKFKIKLEGEAFERVKVAKLKLDAIVATAKKAIDDAQEKGKIANKEMWKVIHTELGTEQSEERHLRIDPRHEDLGIYIIEEVDGCGILDKLKDIFSS